MSSERLPGGLLLAVLVYVALRAAALHLAFDQVAMTNYELYPMGTLPKAILVGAEVPLRAYYDNAAGQLVTGLAALPLYVLFGDGWISLKLVPALCGLGMLLCAWALLDRHASRRAANLAALALALGPAELLAKYSLMASGNHFENLFFTSLALVCFYRLQVVPPERRRRWLLAAGFTQGLAVFVFLGAIVPVGILLVMHLGLRGWRGTGADLRWWGPAFGVGLAPLVLLNLVSQGRGVGFLTAKFQGGRDGGLVLDRMGAFVFEELPRAGFHHRLAGESLRVPNLALVAVFTVAWVAALPAAARGCAQVARAVLGGPRAAFEATVALPFVLLAPLATLAFGLSDLSIDHDWAPRLRVAGFRYFLPIFLFGTVLAAAVLDRWISAGGARRAIGAVLAATLLAVGAWNVSWLREGTPGVGAHYRAWNFKQLARGLFNPSVGLAHGRRVEIAESLPPLLRSQLLRGLGFVEAQLWIIATSRAQGVADLRLPGLRPLPIDELVARYPEQARLDIARGVGSGLGSYFLVRGKHDRLLEVVRDGLVTTCAGGSPWARAVVEGAATLQDFPHPWAEVPAVLARGRRLLGLLPEDLQPTFAGGLGEVCGRLLARRIPQEEAFLADYLHGVFRFGGEQLLVGVGRGLALEGAQGASTPALQRAVPRAEQRAQVERGYQAALRALGR